MLIAVLAAAALLLIVPFAIVWLLTRPSDDGGFEVGSCVRQSGTAAVEARCGESGAFQVVSKVSDAAQCPDPKQPSAVLPNSEGSNRVLCLKPVTNG